ncbi:MAG: YjgN family protein [Pseudomonadota bacterium]
MTTTDPDLQKRHQIQFTGESGEYFRIWIVNIALTLITLGIYSAWATVRNKRYFYANTHLDGENFDFHARPQAILFGRAIAVSILAIYGLVNYFWPLWTLLLIFIILLFVPVLVVRSRIFRMRNTSHRGIRFSFKKDYKEAFKAYYGGALFSVVTLGFGTASAVFWRTRMIVDNSGFGKSRFRLNTTSSGFYQIFWASLGLVILFVSPVFVINYTVNYEEMDLSQVRLLSNVISAITFAAYATVFVFSQVKHRNLIWNATTIEHTNLISSLSVRKMLWLYVSNIVAIIVSVGLLVPWAQIRLARYRASCTQVLQRDDWSTFIADKSTATSATGDEIGEAFDVGFDIGI